MIMKNSPLVTLIVIILFSCGLSVLQAKEKRIRDDDPLMERYRHAEREVKQAVSEGKMSREEAGRKLREIKGKLWGDEREKDNGREKEESGHELRQVERTIHEAIEKSEISHEEARKKLAEVHETHKKASRGREWESIKRRDRGCRAGRQNEPGAGERGI